MAPVSISIAMLSRRVGLPYIVGLVVAGFLINTLKVDWTRGANYFEEKLIDYSPASNWGNWAFIAGVGSDPRENRYFAHSKAGQMETQSEFINIWLPETLAAHDDLMHTDTV